MRVKVLVTRKLPGSAVENLKKDFEVVLNPYDRDLSYEEMTRMARGVRVCSACSATGWTRLLWRKTRI